MEAPTKISGYLEKKGSLKMISSWKKYWFVLEGQLLLYYRSKDEYEGISPCKGSINLCPPCFIKPCNSEKCVFRIEKKTSSITLRAKNRMEQDKWMQGLLMALKSNSLSQSRLSHYRFSACEFGTLEKQTPLQRHRSMPTRYSRNDLKSHPEVLERLRELGAYTVHMPKNKLVRRYGSGGQLYASVGECPVEGQDKRCNVNGFVVENDIYEASQQERVLCRKLSVCYESAESERPSICDVDVVENEGYESIMRRRSFSGSNNTAKDYDYCSLSPSKDSDCNKNSIIIDNDQYMSPLLSETLENTNLSEEAIYEEIDKIREKLGFPQDDLTYAEILDNTATTEESSQKSPKRTLLRNKKSNEKRRNLKKRRSFFGKIMHKWKKRRRVFMDQEEIDSNMKKLLELQQILSQRKAAVEQSLSVVAAAEKKCEDDSDAKKDDFSSIEPALPPKTLAKHFSPYHDTPKNNNPIFLHNTSSEDAKMTPQKSIDKILDDLSREKEEQDSRPNVKKMIERFSVHKEEDEVILRRQKQQQSVAAQDKLILRHSDDLNELLEKLGEMTVAPPREPGGTSSLASPPVSDEEWLKLLPIRKRRMSDPDYDIPRPHRSLVFEPKTENPENVIPATRFFGPVLQSSDFQDISKSPTPTCISISPDSLEIIEKSEQSSNVETISYASHFYSAKQANDYDGVIFVHSKWRPIENDSIESSNEMFVDSLETTTELSTAF